jgi:ribonuclease-3
MNYNFKNESLLKMALTHSSYANEHTMGHINSNERMEFLGDCIVDFIVGEYLFSAYPSLPEGALSRMRAAIVCETALSRAAASLDLGEMLFVGKSEEMSGGRTRSSLLADAFEAVTAAIYLDSDFATAKGWLLAALSDIINETDTGDFTFGDYKTRLQEAIQAKAHAPIKYELAGQSGPEHNKLFTVTVACKGFISGEGDGKSKKAAEQAAAKDMLLKNKL